MNQTEWLVLQMVLQNVFRLEFSHQIKDPECFADRFNITSNPPPFFTQAWLQQYGRRPFFHSTQCSLSNPVRLWSMLVLTRIILHKTCQNFKNCQRTWLLVSLLAPGTSVGSSGFTEKFLFCTGRKDCNHWVAKSCTTTAYRWLCRDSHPSLRTLWSAVIKSPIFPLWARLYQYVFCKKPL